MVLPKTIGITLCMLLTLLPGASAGDQAGMRSLSDGSGIAMTGNPISVCDDAHSGAVVWDEEYENLINLLPDGGFGNDDESPTDPSYRSCISVRGQCTVETVTSAETETKSRGYWLIFVWGNDLRTSSSTSTTTTIECEGTYVFTVTYSGGLGLRSALTSLTTFHSVDGVEKTEGPAKSEPCQYIGGLTRCTTSMKGEWGGTHIHPGSAPKNLEACIEYAAESDTDIVPVPPLTESLGSELCFDMLKLKASADAGFLL